MKIVEKTKERIIILSELNLSLANALRRASSETPILAIDEVEFYKNDCVLNDQMLAHRLGLIPFRNEKLNLPEECSCKGEGCAKCTIQLKLSVDGPKTVYAKDLKGKAEVVYEEMPLAILDEDQKLELVAYARLGRGIEHAKFSPGLVYYRHAYEITGEKCKEVLEKYKRQIYFMEKSGSNYLADLPEACVDELTHLEGVKVKPSSQVVFIIESFGQMDAKDIFSGSIEVLQEQLKQVRKE